MAKAYIREYSFMGANDYGEAQMPREPGIIDRVVDFTAGAAASPAFNSNTAYITVNVDATCSYLVGVNPTATTANLRVVKDATFSTGISPGQKISFISNT